MTKKDDDLKILLFYFSLFEIYVILLSQDLLPILHTLLSLLNSSSFCRLQSLKNHHQTRINYSENFKATTTTTTLKMSSATGFVGLGIMGEGMAARLLSEGIAGTDSNPLIIWNRTKSKCEALKSKFPDKNVVIKDTAKEVIESSDVTYTMLSTPEVSKIVFEGDDGVLAGVSAGKSIVDCATLAEADMKRMDEAVRGKGG